MIYLKQCLNYVRVYVNKICANFKHQSYCIRWTKILLSRFARDQVVSNDPILENKNIELNDPDLRKCIIYQIAQMGWKKN